MTTISQILRERLDASSQATIHAEVTLNDPQGYDTWCYKTTASEAAVSPARVASSQLGPIPVPATTE